MQVKKKHTIRIFSILSTLMIVIALGVAVGSFFYKSYLDEKLVAVRTELDAKSDSVNDEKMKEIEVYDYKLRLAENLLDNHIAVSRIFNVIEGSTKQTVRLLSFDYIYDPGFEAEITLGGNTAELESIALQKMQLIKDDLFSDFVVQDITSASLEEKSKEEAMARDADTEIQLATQDGYGFEIVGLFRKEKIAYQGELRKEPVFDEASALDMAEVHAENVATGTETGAGSSTIETSSVTPMTSVSEE